MNKKQQAGLIAGLTSVLVSGVWFFRAPIAYGLQVLGVPLGGLGLTSTVIGGIPVGSSTSSYTILSPGTNGQVLGVLGGNLSWNAVPGCCGDILYNGGNGTINASCATIAAAGAITTNGNISIKTGIGSNSQYNLYFCCGSSLVGTIVPSVHTTKYSGGTSTLTLNNCGGSFNAPVVAPTVNGTGGNLSLNGDTINNVGTIKLNVNDGNVGTYKHAAVGQSHCYTVVEGRSTLPNTNDVILSSDNGNGTGFLNSASCAYVAQIGGTSNVDSAPFWVSNAGALTTTQTIAVPTVTGNAGTGNLTLDGNVTLASPGTLVVSANTTLNGQTSTVSGNLSVLLNEIITGNLTIDLSQTLLGNLTMSSGGNLTLSGGYSSISAGNATLSGNVSTPTIVGTVGNLTITGNTTSITGNITVNNGSGSGSAITYPVFQVQHNGATWAQFGVNGNQLPFIAGNSATGSLQIGAYNGTTLTVSQLIGSGFIYGPSYALAIHGNVTATAPGNVSAGNLTSVAGMYLTNVNAQSANYTVNSGTTPDAFVTVTTGAGNVTVTFPTAAAGNKGQEVFVAKADSGAGQVIISGTLASVSNITTKGNMDEFISDGSTGWYNK